MIEKIMLDYLSETLSVPVYMEEPETKPSTYVLLEKIGSSETNHIPVANMAVQSYGASLIEAAALNEIVKTAIKDSVQLTEISAVRLNSDYNFTDTETKRYRYQTIFVITYMED